MFVSSMNVDDGNGIQSCLMVYNVYIYIYMCIGNIYIYICNIYMYWSNYSDVRVTRPHPKKAAKEGTSHYFRKIQLGEIL